MDLELQQMYKMQNELDRRIESERGLEKEDLLDEKVLALLVEIGELANETRCFKFWSSKPPSPKETILEEYVDGVHFLLSIGLILPYEVPQQVTLPKVADINPVHAFLKVYESVSIFKNNEDDINNYNRLMEDYLMIGRVLGFTIEEIKDAYLSKNQVNHARQDEGY
ncbi:dUTP diphosphatase [Pseudalkalibacillus salsuginis]|uniref:dUTP diphosphatase n=1 Tax=Pseudalkalibacillus salsuginis TaxID=2910972 RepID=UPI002AFDF103|nr:dUTP diphosphatase [Pseudalkalibacillus salsuginis]